ncbi:MAG: PDZ domain-containing protein [Candidatus Eisenbacteria bacterium]|nr:PDZ domain-containing protein [Candidatus Eisenbacteria bacterium]
MLRRPLCVFASLFVAALSMTASLATESFAVEPHAGMLRFPAVSATHIAFAYANDLWLVPKDGGVATPLASPPGQETFPRFSPDGKTIAFVGNYDGNYDVYTIPVSGGVPFRVTHHPSREILTGWASGDRLIYYAGAVKDYPREYELFTVSAKGGLPEKLPVPYGSNGSISTDGKWLAYTPFTADNRTWKRYRGGMASDVWLFNLTGHTSKKITDWEGTDSQPMWQGDRVYYMSDEGESHRLNIWVYDTKTGQRRQVTYYKDFDVKWPSIGPGSDGQGEIVFQLGPDLCLLDVGTEKAQVVKVTIPGDRPKLRPQLFDAKDVIADGDISSTGKRVVLEARGDVWTLPAKNGSTLNLTRTSGSAERFPTWSPDGQWVAYFSDATGEYELYVTQSDGAGKPRQLTKFDKGFYFAPVWSPDSKWISFWDQVGNLYLQNVDTGETRSVDHYPGMGSEYSRVSWSSDSKWIAYSISKSLGMPDRIWLYDIAKKERHQVTSGMFNDSWPTFDREGKYLFFRSNRDFSSPTYEDYGTTWVYSETGRLYVVPLTSVTASPFAPKSDDEKWGKDKDKKDAGASKEKDKTKDGEGKDVTKDKDKGKEKGEGDSGDKEKAPEPVKIDLEGFEHRAIALPVEPGNFSTLCVNNEGKLVYARNFPQASDEEEPSRRPANSVIHVFDLNEEKEEDREKTVLSGVQGFTMSSDGKKLLVFGKGDVMAIVDAKPDQKMESTISTDGMSVEIDPRAEWRQVFMDSWRIERDFFYDPNMQGIDWTAVRDQYVKMLDDCSSREDVSYVIGEMIAELNVGHAYYFGANTDKAPSVAVGMLGCDFELDAGAYRISRILEGAPWDEDSRGPLSQPGVEVKVGDYLLAVNGVPIDAAKDPWAAFQGMVGRTVRLTVSAEPKITEKARQVLVKLMDSERELRYRAWIEKNRAYVDKSTDGKVGYIYVPDTGVLGQNELVRQFVGQLDKQALIIDERWNGGGQIPTRFVELLNRPIANYWAARTKGENMVWPPDAHHGPKCMLINGEAGSGGDYFPYWFRKAGVGKLIGRRTWGGLIGMSGNPALIDGQSVTVPRFAFYENDGTWGVEGNGVEPDIEVIDDPALMVGGKDPQLDAGIDLMLKEIAEHPYRPVPRPSYPDRSGMGISEENK